MATLRVKPKAQVKVYLFQKEVCSQAESLLESFFPKKISELDDFLKDPSLNEADFSLLKTPLDILVPDPAKGKEKEQPKQEEKDKDEKKKEEDEDKGSPCGPVSCNEQIVAFLGWWKPEIKDVKKQLSLVSMWLQLQAPLIEDGINFGVAVQEKIFELSSELSWLSSTSRSQSISQKGVMQWLKQQSSHMWVTPDSWFMNWMKHNTERHGDLKYLYCVIQHHPEEL